MKHVKVSRTTSSQNKNEFNSIDLKIHFRGSLLDNVGEIRDIEREIERESFWKRGKFVFQELTFDITQIFLSKILSFTFSTRFKLIIIYGSNGRNGRKHGQIFPSAIKK